MPATNNSFGLVSRNNVPSRPSNTITFPQIAFDLQPILDRFNSNIADIRSHFQTADDLLALQPPKQTAAEDIWRSQIVFLDSALDFYIHEIVKYGIVKMFNGDWTESNDYKKMKVRLGFAVDLAQNPNSASKLLEEIDVMNKYSCFMGAKKLKEQLVFIDVNYSLRNSDKNLLNDLYNRRNQIAHQSDRISGQQQKQSITKDYVEDFINKIVNFVVSNLHPVIAAKN